MTRNILIGNKECIEPKKDVDYMLLTPCVETCEDGLGHTVFYDVGCYSTIHKVEFNKHKNRYEFYIKEAAIKKYLHPQQYEKKCKIPYGEAQEIAIIDDDNLKRIENFKIQEKKTKELKTILDNQKIFKNLIKQNIHTLKYNEKHTALDRIKKLKP